MYDEHPDPHCNDRAAALNSSEVNIKNLRIQIKELEARITCLEAELKRFKNTPWEMQDSGCMG